jgi:osomolarity two-component system sensor histidine kinase TcsA
MMRLAVADEFDEVIEAKDGRQALETVQTRMGSNIGTDVVLMDWIMHVMDGLTATRELRKLGFEGFIAGVTGNALPVDVMTFKASGVDEVLTKPLNVNKLKRHLQEHGILTVW